MQDKRDNDHIYKFKYVPKTITVCNLGSSHGLFGFDYSDINCNGEYFNFALSAQSLDYDYRILSYYQDRINKDTIVIVPISYFVLFGIDEQYEKNFESKNIRYYKFLPDAFIKNYQFSQDILVHYFSVLIHPYKLVELINGDLSINTHHEFREKNIFHSSLDDINNDAYSAFERHIIKDKFDNSRNRIINYNEIASLKNIISLCKDKKATVILVTTPYTRAYTECIKNNDEGFYDEFYRLVNDVSREYGVVYLDYACDDRFADDLTLFIDADHMNIKGAKLFTKILLNDITIIKNNIN